MRRRAAAALAAVLALAVLAASAVPEADAAPVRKIHFTSTVHSYENPADGHDDSRIAMLLPPNKGTIYVGSLTYAASAPVNVAVLHELGELDPSGQHAWEIPGQDAYAASYLGANSTSGSLSFAGAAVAIHSSNPEEFVVTASVDAFARGKPAEIAIQKIDIVREPPELSLVRSEIPVVLPLHEGIFDDGRVLYTVTDSSDEDLAEEITRKQDWAVEHAPPLEKLLDGSSEDTGAHEPSTVYIFRNGVKGEGLKNYQLEVFSGAPGEPKYTAASLVVYAEWKSNLHPRVLVSAEEVEEARRDGLVSLEKTRIVLNMPQVYWPDGRLPTSAPEPGAAEAEDAAGDGADDSENGMTGSEDAKDESAEEPVQDPDAPESEAGSEDENGGAGNGESEEAGNGDPTEAADDPAEAEPGPEADEEIFVPETYQVESVDEEKMTATFLARRAWGPEGQTVYHIAVGAAPAGPARVMGAADSPGLQNATSSMISGDLYYFKGGILGDGALGFQPSVASEVPGTEGYSPLWEVHIVEHLGNSTAVVETVGDVEHLRDAEEVMVSPARPLGQSLVVNSPIVNPFQKDGGN